jgi:hypothetical protein
VVFVPTVVVLAGFFVVDGFAPDFDDPDEHAAATSTSTPAATTHFERIATVYSPTARGARSRHHPILGNGPAGPLSSMPSAPYVDAMPFFEPEPPPPNLPPQPAGPWAPPAWDRPSEGTLPAIYPVGEIIHRSEDAIVELELLRVYPNGVSIGFAIRWNPNTPHEQAGGRMLMRRGPGGPYGFPRIGVRFADGRTAGQRGGSFAWMHDVEKDENGIPTQPVITGGGGGGSSYEYQFNVWVFPLPPEGPLEIHTMLSPPDGDETTTVLDGAAIRAAAARAHVIWS